MPTEQASSNFLPGNLSSDNFTLPLLKEIVVDNEKFVLPPIQEKDKKVAETERSNM